MNEVDNQETTGADTVSGSVDSEKIGEPTTSNQDPEQTKHFGGASHEYERLKEMEKENEYNGKVNDVDSESARLDEDQSENPPEKQQKQRYHTPKIFQDAITVLIPLDVTADLKIAIKKTRAKRIASIYKRFPSLQREAKNLDENNNPKVDDPMLDDDEDDKQPPKKKKNLENVPQPDQFGSVLDYLEAKYVKGVMLEEEDDAPPILDDEKSEGQGSVYSKDSFLDDTDLQRDVAEQVMASTTLTKLELEHEDGDFFVNVGNLEVENNDYGENYDPLQDKENKTTKKRKKPSTAATTTPKASSDSKTSGQKSKKKAIPPTKKKEPSSAKSKKSTASVSLAKPKKSQADKGLKLAAKKAKARADSLLKKAATMIKKLTAENLPGLNTKLKVALKCPKNKKPGDDILFAYVPPQCKRLLKGNAFLFCLRLNSRYIVSHIINVFAFLSSVCLITATHTIQVRKFTVFDSI